VVWLVIDGWKRHLGIVVWVIGAPLPAGEPDKPPGHRAVTRHRGPAAGSPRVRHRRGSPTRVGVHRPDSAEDFGHLCPVPRNLGVRTPLLPRFRHTFRRPRAGVLGRVSSLVEPLRLGHTPL